MRICVLGLGYVGTVSAGCLAQEGHDVVDHARTIVIGNAAAEFRDVPKRIGDGQTIIDFVRITDSRSVTGVYEGICW